MGWLLERVGRVALLTRTAAPLNLTTLRSTRDLHGALQALADDDNVRAVVLTGAGDRFFGAGSDLNEFDDLREAGAVITRKLGPENETLALLEQLPKPTIAALNGTALGGGLELALCCDFLIAHTDVQLGLPEIKLGLIPGDGGPARAAARIGHARARRLLFLGEPITAGTALEWGLLDEVVAPGDVRARSLTLAEQLAAMPTTAMRACKRALADARLATPAEAARQALPLFDSVFHSADGHEGIRAFLAHEAPDFR